MKSPVAVAVLALVGLYFAAIFFRYQPMPALSADPHVRVWDRFQGRVCLALGPPNYDPPGVACTNQELEAITARQKNADASMPAVQDVSPFAQSAPNIPPPPAPVAPK